MNRRWFECLVNIICCHIAAITGSFNKSDFWISKRVYSVSFVRGSLPLRPLSKRPISMQLDLPAHSNDHVFWISMIFSNFMQSAKRCKVCKPNILFVCRSSEWLWIIWTIVWMIQSLNDSDWISVCLTHKLSPRMSIGLIVKRFSSVRTIRQRQLTGPNFRSR